MHPWVYCPAVDFYATAAQVIPVFFLLLAFEQRILTPSSVEEPWGVGRFLYVFGAMNAAMLLIAGEIAALVGLSMGRTTATVSAVVWFGLGAGIYSVAAPIFLDQFEELSHGIGKRWWWVPLVTVFVLTFLIAIITHPIWNL